MLTKQKLPPTILNKLLEKFNLGTIKKIKSLATSGNISYIINTDKKNFKQDKKIILKSNFRQKRDFIERFEEEIFCPRADGFFCLSRQ